MPTVEQLQNLLAELGPDVDADVLARAIVALDVEPTKETRVLQASEKR
jgi:hypothetical protein